MKKFSALLFLPLFICCFLYFSARAQNIENTLATYAGKYAQERAYLHYDKSVYAAGETVWFKAYVTEGILPAIGSKTFYVDWVDDKGNVLQHTVSPLVDAVTNGQFEIPAKYSGSFVHVRAYTKWMLNFDSSFLYNKDIRVIGTKENGAVKPAVFSAIQFFPEGGDAVAGVTNKIAFKANNQWGRPVAVKGVVQTSEGVVVTNFAAAHDGMGFFNLLPQPGVTYIAKWKDEKGMEHTTNLPLAKKEGIALQLAVSGNQRRFTINRTADATDNLKQLHLVGTMQENFVFKADVNLSQRTTASGIIPVAALPSGIVTITIFDADWKAVAERITFVNNNDFSFAPQLTVQHWGLNKRARNELQLMVPDSMGANFSVAVTDNAIAADSTDNIITRLLLTSDIKGLVYHPEYYFTSTNDTLQQQLDLVMLTNGWRRFVWDDVVKGKMPVIKYPKDTAYLALSGKLYGMPQAGLNTQGTIVMIVKPKDSSAKMIMAPIDKDGTFINDEATFFDTLHVYYQLQPAKIFRGADVRFMQSRLPPLNYKNAFTSFNTTAFMDTAGNYRYKLLAEENARISELMKEKMLANVVVKAKLKSPMQVMDEKYASGMFATSDSYQFNLLNDPFAASAQNIFSYLQGKVAGLQITTNSGNTTLDWRGAKPQVYIDEMATDVEMLSSLPVNDIAYVKVFRPPFMGGFGGGAGGAIAIYTRKGNDVAPSPGKGLNSNTITGYSPIKQFYSPNYTVTDARNEQRDVRTTLYWNPQVITTPKKNVVVLSFYNNDVSKAFRVIIEGMTKDGRLAHIEQVME